MPNVFQLTNYLLLYFLLKTNMIPSPKSKQSLFQGILTKLTHFLRIFSRLLFRLLPEMNLFKNWHLRRKNPEVSFLLIIISMFVLSSVMTKLGKVLTPNWRGHHHNHLKKWMLLFWTWNYFCLPKKLKWKRIFMFSVAWGK